MNNQNHEQDPALLNDKALAAGAISTVPAVGASISTTLGGMGLAVEDTAFYIATAPVAAGVVVESAAYRTQKAIEEQDATVTQPNEEHSLHDKALAAGAIAAGTVAGVGVSATVGGMGLAVAGTAFGIGTAPVAAAGAVVGSAAYGAKKAIEEQDAMAIAAVVTGAGVGAGVSATIGGMGLAVAGGAVGVTMAPVAAAGAVVGLAVYGLHKLFSGNN